MGKGGARNRSGPGFDPGSLTSAEKGIVLSALDPAGFTGTPPDFPLQPIILFLEYFEGSGRDRVKVKMADDDRTESFRDREADVWAEAWTSPQATAWAVESWRWPIVAEYCRLKTVVEFDPAATAALVSQLHRYRDQIGLTPAGMKENGWKIEAGASPDAAATPARPSSRDRLTVLPGGA